MIFDWCNKIVNFDKEKSHKTFLELPTDSQLANPEVILIIEKLG